MQPICGFLFYGMHTYKNLNFYSKQFTFQCWYFIAGDAFLATCGEEIDNLTIQKEELDSVEWFDLEEVYQAC